MLLGQVQKINRLSLNMLTSELSQHLRDLDRMSFELFKADYSEYNSTKLEKRVSEGLEKDK